MPQIKPPTPPSAFALDSSFRLHHHSRNPELGFHGKGLEHRDPREAREGSGKALAEGGDSQSPGGEAVSLSTRESTPTPASQGQFPLAPPADCFALRSLTLQPDPARSVGDASEPDMEWPDRHCPLVAIVCNYNLPAHNEIRVLTCWGPGALSFQAMRLTIHP